MHYTYLDWLWLCTGSNLKQAVIVSQPGKMPNSIHSNGASYKYEHRVISKPAAVINFICSKGAYHFRSLKGSNMDDYANSVMFLFA